MEYRKIHNIQKQKDSLDALSPYIGKMRPELAEWLIRTYAKNGEKIYDPFAGSGTVLLKGWELGHEVIGNDLNDYAYVLAKGKLFPHENENKAIDKLNKYNKYVISNAKNYDVSSIPQWVKDFYHVDTLKETCCWVRILKYHKEWFLLSCLMGILHHQRPGFLSFPSSHGAPYLRKNKYPQEEYPEMYEYKNVYVRLKAKVTRTYKHFPNVNFDINRDIKKKDATGIRLGDANISTIITSPPYMKSLTYARDNRLRLWFLGVEDWKGLEKNISPEKGIFFDEMERCFKRWYKLQKTGDRCILVVGNIKVLYEGLKSTMPDILTNLASRYYYLSEAYIDSIPEKRKVVKGASSIKQEVVLVLERR